MIEVKNISKSFGDNHVLKGISSYFEKGKTNLIIGQSGSGKTVLLKSIIGLHEIDEGEIFYEDQEFSKMPVKGKKKQLVELASISDVAQCRRETSGAFFPGE